MALLSRYQILGGFVAGALAVLVFHQGLVFLINQAGLGGYPVYSWAPTRPFGVPQLLSIAFWGGLWGIVWAMLSSRLKGGGGLVFAFLFGAILPTLVFAAVVAPLKGIDGRIWLDPARLAFALAVNGAWGVGTELFLRLGRGRIW
ncbi:MAG: hypothetical protein BroJett029_22210 [Alphaproteobacteria bacterium]|nr:MAG: hypothetical protein BroJett029_22210 [Alphaproteobacteria bacterium]